MGSLSLAFGVLGLGLGVLGFTGSGVQGLELDSVASRVQGGIRNKPPPE